MLDYHEIKSNEHFNANDNSNSNAYILLFCGLPLDLFLLAGITRVLRSSSSLSLQTHWWNNSLDLRTSPMTIFSSRDNAIIGEHIECTRGSTPFHDLLYFLQDLHFLTSIVEYLHQHQQLRHGVCLFISSCILQQSDLACRNWNILAWIYLSWSWILDWLDAFLPLVPISSHLSNSGCKN